MAGAYVVLQFLLSWHTRLGWDESVYVSQVSPRLPAAFFTAPRARGVPALAAPVLVFTDSVRVVRTYLMLAAGAGLVAAYWPWLRRRGGVAVPLAAGLFAVLWPALFYGPEAMPNLWVAFATVAAVGWFLIAAAEPGDRRALLGVAGGIVVAALMRPADSAWLSLSLFLAGCLVRGWRRRDLFATVLLATVVGWAPWVVEAYTSYGGLIARLKAGSAIQGGTTPRFGVVTALRSVNGPALCRPCTHPVPVSGALLWLGGLAVVGLALVTARRRDFRGTVLATLTGVAMAVPYLFLLGYSAPRFLLPAYALLVLPVADGLLWLAAAGRSSAARWSLRAGVAVLLLGLLAFQLVVLRANLRSNDRQRDAWAALATALNRTGIRPPCVIGGDQSPPIAWLAGCSSHLTGGTTVRGLRRIGVTAPAAIVATEGEPRPASLRSWRTVRVATAYRRWTVFLSPAAR